MHFGRGKNASPIRSWPAKRRNTVRKKTQRRSLNKTLTTLSDSMSFRMSSFPMSTSPPSLVLSMAVAANIIITIDRWIPNAQRLLYNTCSWSWTNHFLHCVLSRKTLEHDFTINYSSRWKHTLIHLGYPILNQTVGSLIWSRNKICVGDWKLRVQWRTPSTLNEIEIRNWTEKTAKIMHSKLSSTSTSHRRVLSN